ncbi:MAG: (Fe-S)-binding protein [Planctomycetota bacterium]|jgi:Fe-S oxidoreductase
MTSRIQDILKSTGSLACLDCGKCTAVCPVSRNSRFSPRLAVTLLSVNGLTPDSGIWDCLTCDRCNLECPSDVHFGEMVGKVRRLAFREGRLDVPCAHGGALHSMMRLAGMESAHPRRLDWVSADARIAEKGEILYFVGCLPQFDVFFNELPQQVGTTAHASLRLLNALDIAPVVLPDERCCGHDLLWTGDVESFDRLARLNIEAIERSGAKTVVFSCAECYWTFQNDIAERFGPLDFHCIHLSEFLASKVGSLPLRSSPITVTYHDPCRLGRFAGVYSPPRELLKAIPGLRLKEMERSRAKAACCGTSLWAACGPVSRMLQRERLREAVDTGAETLATTCPKCRIHFACARLGEGAEQAKALAVRDVVEVLAEALEEA